MSIEILKRAEALAKEVKYFFLVTSNSQGQHHIACIKDFEILSQQSVAVKAWFCPVSMVNLEENRALALFMHNADMDSGYQLVGELLRADDIAVLDGYARKEEEARCFPQAQKRLVIQIDKVMEFTRAAHADKEL
ncbi:MAG: hypothetical protein HY589_02230 [Candidatus Omnitrophica bacterium]|nr:hypothetical protein [Candidatus Omnitrophota bacterium]